MTDLRQRDPVPGSGSTGRRDLQQDRASFYLTGRRMDTRLGHVEGLALRSAQFAAYRDLHELRYDYPLVLVDSVDFASTVRSLSGVVDDLLATVAVGPDGDRIRHHAMLLERQVRIHADAGVARLSAVWGSCVQELTGEDPDELLADSLARLTAARTVDGDLVACTSQTPRQVIGHLWGLVQRQRMGLLAARISYLRQGLQDILDAEHANSAAGLASDRLADSLGPVFEAELDVESLSRMLTERRPRLVLADSRRERVCRLLDVLTTQRFVPDGTEPAPAAELVERFEFAYSSSIEALAAYHDRRAATTELAKALVIAGMETDGRYREEIHDALFEKWSVEDLETDLLRLFPEYLVRVDAETMSAAESVALLEAIASGLPIKVLVQVNDLLHDSSSDRRRPDDGLSAWMLANAARANGDSFVMQCSSASLYHARDRIVSGSMAHGAALFVVYAGGGQWLGEVPPYLASAAATESRVFPSFVYDPAHGRTWADRFSLACNPALERDWPVRPLDYEDHELQRVALELPFTAADFWAGDARMLSHLALASEEAQGGTVVPFAEHLASDPQVWADELPYVLMISEDNRLHRVLVDRPLVRAAQRVVERWHRLQELGGVHNSHVARELARQQKEFEAQREDLLTRQAPAPAAPAGAPSSGTAPPTGTAPATADLEDDLLEPQAHDPYLPWIETARCSTCNECTMLNDRMFAYNDNRQAYIADPDAGTYAELVEAAESCQVAIIHPGKPRNPAEPGLAELIKRAEPFA